MQSDHVPVPFGQLLVRARRAAGLTQEELAERAGVSWRAVSDLKRGARQTRRRDTLAMLADALVHHQAAWFAADLLPCRVVGGLTRWG
ncbi:MAG TPA: helix-turn-helix transcriptional regulator [Chloroflexota bacterium]|nr:helix-turn-helix transcriptional regulator [Chloroflexota bacterium]